MIFGINQLFIIVLSHLSSYFLSLLGPNTFLNTLFSSTLSIFFPYL